MWHLQVLLATAAAAKAAFSSLPACSRAPTTRIDCYPSQLHFPNATEEFCRAQGCCWDPTHPSVPCAFDTLRRPSDASCRAVVSRMECRNPRYFHIAKDEATCHAMGCCFDGATGDCFQPAFAGYILNRSSWKETEAGNFRGMLHLPKHARGPFGNDIPTLQLDVILSRDPSYVRIRITDPAFARYEVPLALHDAHEHEDELETVHDHPPTSRPIFGVHVTYDPFGIAITRRATGETLFNSTPPIDMHFNGLIFENQFLEISTSTITRAHFFGGGERYSIIIHIYSRHIS
jgi:lysosomal alpha-glucosidase